MTISHLTGLKKVITKRLSLLICPHLSVPYLKGILFSGILVPLICDTHYTSYVFRHLSEIIRCIDIFIPKYKVEFDNKSVCLHTRRLTAGVEKGVCEVVEGKEGKGRMACVASITV